MPRITCPTCGAALAAADDELGREVECGGCRARFVAEPPRRPPRRRYDEDDPDAGAPRPVKHGDPGGVAASAVLLGILAVAFAPCGGVLSFPCGVAGVFLGLKGMKTEARPKALVGLAASALGLLAGVISFSFWTSDFAIFGSGPVAQPVAAPVKAPPPPPAPPIPAQPQQPKE
jgi:hypothetical protein